MPNSSRFSRVLLGASLTVAVALIIVVASSRPSISKQDTQLLLSQNEESGAGALADSATSLPTEAPDVPSGDVLENAAASSNAQASGAADAPPAAEDESGDDNREQTPIVEQVAMSPIAVSLQGQGDANVEPAAAGTATQESAASKPAKKSPQKPQRKPTGEQTEEPKTGDRLDPLKRLSGEFARRAAARRNSQPKATPVAPPANEIFPPTVAMSQEHRKSCIVFVGEAMPDGKLKDGTGEEHSIQQSLGEQLTAIVFWNANNPYALDQFEELPNDLVPFTTLGVQTVAVHVGPEPANYAELCQQYGANVLCLVDPDEAYFKKVSNGSVPRSYLLDADGMIIWLDIEYSRTTRYELRNALHFSLSD